MRTTTWIVGVGCRAFVAAIKATELGAHVEMVETRHSGWHLREFSSTDESRRSVSALPKIGLVVLAAGALDLADIGISRRVYDRAGINIPPDIFGARYVVPIRAVDM